MTAEDEIPTSKKLIAVCGLMLFGALNTLTSKIQFTMMAEGRGEYKLFEKPFFATFTMFMAMTCVLPIHKLQQMSARKIAAADGSDPLLMTEEAAEGVSESRAFMLIGIPASFDLAATGLMLWGLLLMPASIYQMLRGSMIIFGSIIRVAVLRHPQYAYNWLGVLVCTLGVTCVGASSVFNTKSGAASPGKDITVEQSIFGVILVISAQVLQAAQVVVEEKFLKEVKLPPLLIVGYEGLWGCILSLVCVFPLLWYLPGKDNGHAEDTLQSIAMVYNTPELMALIVLYLFSCSTFNISSVFTTKYFNAVHRTMLEASRTSVIWAFGLIVHYCINRQAAFGESWLPYSYLELLGFFVLFFGQTLYGGIVRVPCLWYPAAPAPSVQPIMSP